VNGVKSDTKLFCKCCGKAIYRYDPEFWDGKTYQDAHFCAADRCVRIFAYAAADKFPSFSMPAHKARRQKFVNSNEAAKEERKLNAHMRRMARQALNV